MPLRWKADLRTMQHPREFWNERFGHDYYVYGTEPNRWFADQLAKLHPGRLLLPAEGEGRNAVHAARQGWEVTAIDMSEQGRRKALQLAEKNGVHIDYRIGTLAELPGLPHDFDALGMIYAHVEAPARKQFNTAATGLMRPGGTLIFEAFSVGQLAYQPVHNSGGPRQADMLFTVDAVRQEFPAIVFSVLREEEVTLHEGRGHQGLARVVRALGVKR